MKTNFLLIPLMGLSILTGCKEDEADWESMIRDKYNYKVNISIQQSEVSTTTIKAELCKPIVHVGNYAFNGYAYDLILSQTTQDKKAGDEIKKAVLDIKAPGGYWVQLDALYSDAVYNENTWNK